MEVTTAPFYNADYLKLKKEHQLFIAKFFETRDHITAYLFAYPGSTRITASIKGKQLCRKAKIKLLIGSVMRSGEQIINEARHEIVRQQAINILSEAEIDARLSQMVMGTLLIEREIVVDGLRMNVKVPPMHSDINRAAELLYKRKGSLSPERIDLLTQGTAPVANVIILSNGTHIPFG